MTSKNVVAVLLFSRRSTLRGIELVMYTVNTPFDSSELHLVF